MKRLHLFACLVVAGLPWSVQTVPAATQQPHTRADVNVLAFSRDGQFIAAGLENNSLIIRAAATGEIHWRLRVEYAVESLDFSPDGRTLAVGDVGQISIWNLETGQRVRQISTSASFESHVLPGTVDAIRFVDNQTLVSGVRQHIQWWNIANGRLLKHASTTGWRFGSWMSTCCGSDVATLAVSPSARTVIAGTVDGFAYLWTLESGSLKEVIDGHGEHFSGAGLYMSSDTDWLWLMPLEETFGSALSVRDPRGEQRRLVGSSVAQVMAVDISPDGQLMAATSALGAIDVWRRRSARPFASWRTGTPLRALAFSPDSSRLASGGENGSVRMWEARTGKDLWAR